MGLLNILNNMDASRFQIIFFTIVCLVVAVLSFFIFQPFITVLVLAATTAVIASPLYKRILKAYKGKKALASLSTVAIVLIVAFVPLSLLAVKLLNEARDLYFSLSAGRIPGIEDLSNILNAKAQTIFPTANIDIRAYLSEVSSWLITHLGNFFSVTLEILLKFFLGVIALFYFLKDGDSFKDSIKLFSPLPDTSDNFIFETLRKTVKSVLVGSVVVAIIQGFLTGLGFTIFGVPNGVLWGTVAALAALIPGMGTSLVVVPGVLYLAFFHGGYAWIGLAVWGAVFVGLIDNFLGPKLVERGVNIHPLLILFSILGGVAFFGPEGFLLGPLVLSLLFALIRMYNGLIKQNKFE
jgi:predicted PurR-regulated permease PerM